MDLSLVWRTGRKFLPKIYFYNNNSLGFHILSSFLPFLLLYPSMLKWKRFWNWSISSFSFCPLREINFMAGLDALSVCECTLPLELMMPIGNQKFCIPRKYQFQIGIWYFCPKFLGIFLVFCRNLEHSLLKIWLNIGIFRQNEIGLVFGFRGCYFIGIGLVSVCHFPESGISNKNHRP